MNYIIALSLTLNFIMGGTVALVLLNQKWSFRAFFRKVYGKYLISKRVRAEKRAYLALPKQEVALSSHVYTEDKQRVEISYWEAMDGTSPEPFLAYHYPQGGVMNGRDMPVDSYDIRGSVWEGEIFRLKYRQALVAKVVSVSASLAPTHRKSRYTNRKFVDVVPPPPPSNPPPLLPTTRTQSEIEDQKLDFS